MISFTGTNEIKYYVADGKVRTYNWSPFVIDALHADQCSNFTLTTDNVYDDGFVPNWLNFTFSANTFSVQVNDTSMTVPKLTAQIVIKAQIDGAVCYQLLTLTITKIPKLNFKVKEGAAYNMTTEINLT